MSQLLNYISYGILALNTIVIVVTIMLIVWDMRRIARLERFADQSCAVWNNTFSQCATCGDMLFTMNAATTVHTAEGTKYLCEACRDAKL